MSNAFTLAENYKTEEYSQETYNMYEESWIYTEFKESWTDTQFDEPLTPTELEEHWTPTELEEHWTPTELEEWEKNKNWWENQNPTNTPNSNWVDDDDDDIPVWRTCI
jgi:hypothetical protein